MARPKLNKLNPQEVQDLESALVFCETLSKSHLKVLHKMQDKQITQKEKGWEKIYFKIGEFSEAVGIHPRTTKRAFNEIPWIKRKKCFRPGILKGKWGRRQINNEYGFTNIGWSLLMALRRMGIFKYSDRKEFKQNLQSLWKRSVEYDGLINYLRYLDKKKPTECKALRESLDYLFLVFCHPHSTEKRDELFVTPTSSYTNSNTSMGEKTGHRYKDRNFKFGKSKIMPIEISPYLKDVEFLSLQDKRKLSLIAEHWFIESKAQADWRLGERTLVVKDYGSYIKETAIQMAVKSGQTVDFRRFYATISG